MVAWTANAIPPQTGKIVIVTGATGGLGYETALYFAQAGATVIVAGRNETKGKDALTNIKKICPEDKAVFGKIDQCSLKSVSDFCAWFTNNYPRLDILINNAGLLSKKREVTKDGFEAVMETNHLSHFALTAQLLPALRKSKAPRVVNVSSIGAVAGKMDFDNLQAEKTWNDLTQYGTTKLANLLFTFELQRRSDEGGWGLTVNAAHPGVSITPMLDGYTKDQWFFQKWMWSLWSFWTHSAAEGALSLMYAAVAPEATKYGYYGPKNWSEWKGPPAPAKIPETARNLNDAKKLWEVSEKLTKVTWPSI